MTKKVTRVDKTVDLHKQAVDALQAKNEEHEALNEELRSTIAQLQAATEELQAQNEELQQQEVALRESEEKYRLLFDSGGDAIFIHDEEARILAVNQQACEQFGYTHSELMSMTVNQMDSPAAGKHVPERIDRVIEQGSLLFEIVHQRKDGSLVPHEVNTRRIIWDGQPAIMSICRDITARKRIEDALLNSEAQKNAILNGITTNIALVDKELKILWANKAAAISVSKQVDDIVGHPCYFFWGNKVAPCVNCPTIKAFQTGKSEHIIVKTPDGRIWDERGEPILDSAGNVTAVVEIAQDITERKQAEEALRESEEKFRLIFDSSPVGIGIATLNGQILGANAATIKMMGYTLEELNTINVRNTYVRPDDRNLILEILKETGAVCDYEVELKRKDGSAYWALLNMDKLHLNGQDIFLSTHRDITYRKQAEHALKESEERHKRMIANISDVIAIMDKDGTLKYKSPNIEKWFGWQPEDLVGTDGWLTVHPDDLERIQKEFFTLLDKDNSVATVEYRYKCKDGSYKLIALTAVNLTNDPIISGVLMNYRDITESKRMVEEKEILEAQNRQLQKTESLSRMAAAIAHHFNNQLGAVIGNLEMAMDELPKGASTHQTLTKAMQSAWTAADMSGLMLTYLGQTHDKRESLDLSYSCRKILPLIETSLPGNVVMETDFPLPRPIIMANVGEIQQILTNMLTNAWEAVGKNSGTISLSVKTVSPAEITTVHRHPIDWQPQGKAYACLEVTDTGCGIEDKAIEQLFDPFFTDKFTGRGMGLPVVLGIVKAYKGVITVDSKPVSGSTFRIFFPVSEEGPRQPQTTENDRDVTISAPSPRKMEEGGTVLVVEDEEPLRKMAAIMLERLGFIVLEAKDGIEALDVFGKHQSEIRFVLTDLTMPRMNGWETLTALRKLQPDIPVILASGYDLAHVMEGDHPELPQAFLAKPYNLKALRAAISQALEKAMEG